MSVDMIVLASLGWIVAICFALCVIAVTVTLVHDVWLTVVKGR